MYDRYCVYSVSVCVPSWQDVVVETPAVVGTATELVLSLAGIHVSVDIFVSGMVSQE